MNRAKLLWLNGRVSICIDLDPKTTRVEVFDGDGRCHSFFPTEETNAEGDDIYREEESSEAWTKHRPKSGAGNVDAHRLSDGAVQK